MQFKDLRKKQNNMCRMGKNFFRKSNVPSCVAAETKLNVKVPFGPIIRLMWLQYETV